MGSGAELYEDWCRICVCDFALLSFKYFTFNFVILDLRKKRLQVNMIPLNTSRSGTPALKSASGFKDLVELGSCDFLITSVFS